MNPSKLEMVTSFGYWVRRRRKALDLTQTALAQAVGCALITLKKIEADERRPSPQMAERLADYLAIPAMERDQFLRMARGEFVPAMLSASVGVEAYFFKHNLPSQATPFIGREKELADIARRLLDPTCRLLTLVGPGGIGKTRLALQAAQHLVDSEANRAIFAQGIVFIPLLPVSSLGGLISAIAEAANFTFYSKVSPRQQLLDYLREKAMLLVLDNFEHLLALAKRGISGEPSLTGDTGPETLIAEILRVAPAVKILITSREALNLQEAWFHPVDGLSCPHEDLIEGEVFEAYDAIRLFVQSARRAQVGFSAVSQQQNIVRICWLVEGMPLAIELATAWLKILPCEQMVKHLEQNLDFLTTPFQNIPERHRSIRAVFEHSWQLLAETERAAFKRLSVFRGGFRQDAAEHVAGASLLILRTLVEKSLLRPTNTGRYQVHELLRQFASEKLYVNPTEQNTTQEQHSHYYLAFLQARAQFLKGKQQRTALAEIGEEIENVRAGWIWAVDHGQIDRLDQALEGFYNFYQIEGRYQEGEETFGYAAMSLRQPAGVEPLNFKITHTRILTRWGTFQGFLGLSELAKNRLQIGLTVAQELGDQREAAFCLNLLGYFTGWLGDYLKAQRLIQQSLALSRALVDQEGMALTLYNLAEIAQYLGENEEAKRLAQESLALSRTLGRQDWIAYGLDKLGFNTFALGEFAVSEQYYQEGLAIFEEIGDKLGMSLTLGGLSWAAWVKGDSNLDEAIALAEKSLAVVRECGHRFHIATRLGVALGTCLNRSGQLERAQQIFLEGLMLSKELEAPVPMMHCLSGLGDIKRQLGDLQASKKYLLEALKTGVSAQLLPHTSETLVYYIALLAQESDSLKDSKPTKRQKQIQAIELTSLILHHPACWQVFKDRAVRLRTKLESHVPAEIAAAAWMRGKSRTLEAVVAEILEVNHV